MTAPPCWCGRETSHVNQHQERHRAKKSLGQNFLIDPNLQRKIVAALDPSPDDEILEIGPGLGALTDHLVGTVARLVLVELDDSLADRLQKRFADRADVAVVHGDFLDLQLEALSDEPAGLKVVGNIPYNITTPILFSLLERQPRPSRIVLMVQREVADRILALPGSKTYGALAIGVQSVASVERVLNVGRAAFRPAPDVDSAVVRIIPLVPPPLSTQQEHDLRALTRAAFGQRRKQFQKILRNTYSMSHDEVADVAEATGFDLRQRPETFSPDQFVRLASALGRGANTD
ncbi:MAG TPA: 16S rRNA (adenine(1518)-N(6)/adenine(1519)-N(6))-dimethyltransferase RsmA [Longimicrobiaceae bacterium]|nr:16S rRNA (adenine(1518)-N(6)/adenine(1519)-N(6))-dimethyltransferase RsmA [Longimicrobiaceae bacterium]